MSRFDTVVVEQPHTNIIEVITPGPQGPPGGGTGSGVNGGVFIQDVVPQDSAENIGSREFTEDGTALLEMTTTTDLVNVQILALTGHSLYTPEITVNGASVTLSETEDRSLFYGSISIDLNGSTTITASHMDGPEWVTAVYYEARPAVQSALFEGDYPGTQTELKEGDTFDFYVQADKDFDRVEIADSGAFAYKSFSLSPGAEFYGTATIADRGNSAQDLGFRARVRTPEGAWSDWFESSSQGSDNPLHVVTLNNQYPELSVTDVYYPSGQEALKDSEQATVSNSASYFDTITYSSSQLDIENPEVFEATKTVTRASGSYNIDPNLTISANRQANNASSAVSATVRIASVAASISISTSQSRLRSGGYHGTSAQNHSIDIVADQELIEAPTIIPDAGTWVDSWSGSGTTWSRTLQVHDDDPKGVFSWGSPSCRNLAGIVGTSVSSGLSYELGGFVFRVFTVDAYPNREADIMTQVADTSKLQCTNLSEGDTGTLNYTYQSTTDSANDRYTILDGHIWYNCDDSNATSNTAGSMEIELEEVV